MKEQEKTSANAETENKKTPTAAEVQRRRKMLIYPLFFLAFAVCIWLILSGGSKDDATSEGFNTSLPAPAGTGIVSDKQDAYRKDALQRKEDAKRRSLQDYAFELANETDTERRARIEREQRMAPKPVEYYEEPERFSGNAYREAGDAYKNLNSQIGNIYETPAADAEKEQMQQRIAQLETALSQEQERGTSEEEQLALFEKSYEIAARYMNAGQVADTSAKAAQPAARKPVAVPVVQLPRNVVSRLAAPMPDSVFRAEFVKPRNWGFNTLGSADRQTRRTSIRACVYRTIKISDGGEVAFRLQEPMIAGDRLIPANTILTGIGKIGGGRMNITITAVQVDGDIIPVELGVYDLDGMEGVAVPASDEVNAVKEIAANMGSGMGSSITITDDASSQLLSDLGRSAIQGVAQYVGKKMRTVNVTLKSGYKVLLVPPVGQ